MSIRSKPTAVVIALFTTLLVVAGAIAVRVGSQRADCPPPTSNPKWSVARRWDEALLDAIRRDVPAPTVHSRNLFHTSAAMWDAWAAYDPEAIGVFVNEDHRVSNVVAARAETISYAAFRVLESRYLDSIGAVESISEFDRLMDSFCFPIDITTTEGDSPAAVGNRIAAQILSATLQDGSNEAEGYVDPDYQPVNPPLVTSSSGATMIDPNRWQPLELEEMISQNGILVEDGFQEFVDPHWGHVRGFALADPGPDGLPIIPGDPPYLGDPATDQEFKDAAIEVLRYSSMLDPAAGTMVDISPATLGANPLGTNDGIGRVTNPITGTAYQPNVVDQADFGRVLAEFWADGPNSETPPGHWNTLANTVSDSLDPNLRIGGTGDVVDRLEWDVKLYLALNAANHDAAVAAWGAKGYYDYVRPISMIRYMGGLGQSSDPNSTSFHPEGLPTVPGLVEVVTEESSRPGERHADLAGHVDEIAVRAWRGTPEHPDAETSGVGWILATDWVPYQKPTFVTPAFAGYVSGHSAFSRASAEILTAFTGSEYFPGGLGEWTIHAGSLAFERGPAVDVTLQWATYRDAADQAGRSRLFGGIHVRADDFAGRLMGEHVGLACWNRVQSYYGA